MIDPDQPTEVITQNEACQVLFPRASWQRCQIHLQQNAQSYITKRSLTKEVTETIRAIFEAENKSKADRLLKIVIEKDSQDMPQLTQWTEEGIPEGFTIFHFSVKHQRRLCTSNIAERINQKIRRRARVARIFPNAASCERFLGAILIAISEDWRAGTVYLNVH